VSGRVNSTPATGAAAHEKAAPPKKSVAEGRLFHGRYAVSRLEDLLPGKLLRRAFQAAVTDPGFIAEAQRQRVQMDPVTSNRVHEILDAAYAMPSDVVKAANEALNITGASDN
jgi:hypothetical protein